MSATVAITNERTNMVVSSFSWLVSIHEHACASRTCSVALKNQNEVQGVQPGDPLDCVGGFAHQRKKTPLHRCAKRLPEQGAFFVRQSDKFIVFLRCGPA